MITGEDGGQLQVSLTRDAARIAAGGGLDYRTEVCTLELLFSEYIQSFIPTAESFAPGDKLTSSDIDQVIYLVRLLREWVIEQLTVFINSPANTVDPFFAQAPRPQLVAVREIDFKPAAILPISVYLQQLSVRYSGISFCGELTSIAEHIFKIGVSNKPEDEGKHFLLLPDQNELLCAARDNELYVSAPY